MKSKNKDAKSVRLFKKLPAIASFRRCHVITDAEMLSVMEDGTKIPVGVYRVGLRGTQNVNDGLGNVHQKRNGDEGDRGVQQPQVVETAKVDGAAVALAVRFGLSMLDLRNGLELCLDSQEPAAAFAFRSSINDFVDRARNSNAIRLLARRYARNIANGRWLWRNRTIARSIRVVVHDTTAKPVAEFDSLTLPLTHFRQVTEAEELLANALEDQMLGRSLEGLTVEAVVTLAVSGSVEVFPSQNYIERDRRKTGSDDIGRSLYRIRSTRSVDLDEVASGLVGFAAIRDAKIFNAIRTIDTWYDSYEETGMPIPVEPLGASIAHQEFFRRGEHCAFELFKHLDDIDPESDDGLYCLACIERGGVYGPARLISAKKDDNSRKLTLLDQVRVSTDGPEVAALSTDVAETKAKARKAPAKTSSSKGKAAKDGAGKAPPLVRKSNKLDRTVSENAT